MTETLRYRAADLVNFAREALLRIGLDRPKAEVVSEILVEGDLLGHTTHGLALLPAYLADAEKGGMTKTGEPKVMADFPAAITWDGLRLPGPWLVTKAVDLAISRAKVHATATVVIRRSHHIGCLAAYLRRATDQGLMILLSCSDPTVFGVVPHGGTRSVFTPNPIAAGWPTGKDPVLMDVSQSITSLGFVKRRAAEGRKLPGRWVVDAKGQASDDPSVVFANPPGSLLPSGGTDHGHKGYAFGLLVEALTAGLSGHGRADPPEGWTATVFLQVLDPALFGGREDFVRQMEAVAASCRDNPPAAGVDRVRLPGEAGLEKRRRQLAAGVELYPSIRPSLEPWVSQLGLSFPSPL